MDDIILVFSILLIVLSALFIFISFYGSSKQKELDKFTRPEDNSIDEWVFEKGIRDFPIKNSKLAVVKAEMGKKIVGMDEFINSMLLALIVEWNILVEWVPGLAKTKTIDILSQTLWLDFSRIQFTPDMLPSDIVGTDILNSKTNEFEIRFGPIFANIVLADEINRTTPKVQSALLEAMQEKKVTIWNTTYDLPSPFFVMATQNPLEQEGTYQLPEAQIDRFFFKVLVDYPSKSEETKILDVLENDEFIEIDKLLSREELVEIQKDVKKVQISEDIKSYAVRLAKATRVYASEGVLYGASPRASICLMQWAKGLAYMENRDYVTIEDIQKIALLVFRHRIILSYDLIVDGISPDKILLDIFSGVKMFE